MPDSVEHILNNIVFRYHLLVDVEERTGRTGIRRRYYRSMEKNTVFVAIFNHVKCVGTIRVRMLDEKTGLYLSFWGAELPPSLAAIGSPGAALTAAEEWFLDQVRLLSLCRPPWHDTFGELLHQAGFHWCRFPMNKATSEGN